MIILDYYIATMFRTARQRLAESTHFPNVYILTWLHYLNYQNNNTELYNYNVTALILYKALELKNFAYKIT